MHSSPSDDAATHSDTKTRATGSPYRRVPEPGSVSMLGLGMVIGAVIGAGIALLSTPRSGEEMRDKIRDRVRHIRGEDDAWSKLKRELKRAAKVRQRSELTKRREREEKMLERQRAERDARTADLGT